MLDGPEIPESPEVKHRVRGRRIGVRATPRHRLILAGQPD